MPPNTRKSARIRSSTYKQSSINRPARRVNVKVHWIDENNLPLQVRRGYEGYYTREYPEFTILDTQTISGILNKIRARLMGRYPMLEHGFVMQINYYSPPPPGSWKMYETTKVQIKPSMGRNTKLSSLMPRGHRFELIELIIHSVKGVTKKIMDRSNPGISYRPSNVFRP